MGEAMRVKQRITPTSDPTERHPEYSKRKPQWVKVRDCIEGEEEIKRKQETYLPRPEGMSGQYADAYDAYIERAHFPLICGYALAGSIGIIIAKIPEFNMPKELEYLLENATKDGVSMRQLFLDIITEIFITGRCPVLVDLVESINKFKFIQYKAEDLINWKVESIDTESNLILAVFKEDVPDDYDIFSHTTVELQRVLYINELGQFAVKVYEEGDEIINESVVPNYMGNISDQIPVFIAGSISKSYDMQPVPLLATANASIQIYRKEADLSNSEFLSCNPTLIFTGVSNDADLPNVVGSSVLISLPNDQSRAFYTITDTAALSHVKGHIDDLYEEAIRHGVAILDTRKGVESAESLRIRQSTQSATIYSIYLSAASVIEEGLKYMAKMMNLNEDDVSVDAPTSLTSNIPDASVIGKVIEGFGANVVPLNVIYRYMINSNLIDQTVSYEDYVESLRDSVALKNEFAPAIKEVETVADGTGTEPAVTGSTSTVSKGIKSKEKNLEKEGSEIDTQMDG
jgi:hypothetical protein